MYLCNKGIYDGLGVMWKLIRKIFVNEDDIMLEIMNVVKKILREN